ncbi:MAG: glycosyltransferase family 2 protein, partial [Nocardioidaceae bacterium]|nr:glycosyltransferase family 2 protein [Nocardioidaceae bacterium]
DSAVVSMNDGSSAALYVRDKDRFLDLSRRSAALHLRFRKEWDELAAQYRDALADITSPQTWAKTFAPWGDQDEQERDG